MSRRELPFAIAANYPAETMLRWDPTDFLCCLGVLPREREHGISHSYSIEKHGMRLELEVWQYDGDIHLTLWRDGVDAPVVALRLVGCDAARRVHDKLGDHLEFAAGALFGGRYDGESVIPYGIRVRVEPSIGVEFFRSSS